MDRRSAHRLRARPRRSLGRRVRQRVRVRSRGGGEGAARAFQRRRRGRRRQLFPRNLSEVLQRLFQEDVAHAHLHQGVRAARGHPVGGGDAETRRLERESSARGVSSLAFAAMGVTASDAPPSAAARVLGPTDAISGRLLRNGNTFP